MKALRTLLQRLNITVLPRVVVVDFLGRQYMVRNGTVDDGDYDDAWMLAIAHRSKVIFDIGSNIGQSAFTMLHAPNVERIVLVDPAPLALTIAADTLIRNSMSHRATFVNAFVSNTEDDEIVFHSDSGYGTGGYALLENDSKVSAVSLNRIKTTTIDSLVNKLGVTPDFVKIDVEYYERQVMSGSSSLAAKAKTRFLIEMHSERKSQRQNTEEILEWCNQNNYVAWYMKEAQKIDSADPVAHRGRYHLLLQPKGWEYPTWLADLPQKAPVIAGLPKAEGT